MYGYVFPIFFSATCTDFSMVKMPPRNIWIRLFSCALQTTTILHCLYCAKLSAQIIKCIELWEFSTHPLEQNKHKLSCGLRQQQSWLRQGIQQKGLSCLLHYWNITFSFITFRKKPFQSIPSIIKHKVNPSHVLPFLKVMQKSQASF